MSSLNKVLLIGRLGLAPEMKTTSQGEPLARLRLATRQFRRKDGAREEETEWHDVTVFGRLAEQCQTYLDKGRLLFVEGRIRSSTWSDRDGKKRLSREVVARRIDFLDSPSASATGGATTVGDDRAL